MEDLNFARVGGFHMQDLGNINIIWAFIKTRIGGVNSEC